MIPTILLHHVETFQLCNHPVPKCKNKSIIWLQSNWFSSHIKKIKIPSQTFSDVSDIYLTHFWIMGDSFLQKDSLITHILFELWLITLLWIVLVFLTQTLDSDLLQFLSHSALELLALKAGCLSVLWFVCQNFCLKDWWEPSEFIVLYFLCSYLNRFWRFQGLWNPWQMSYGSPHKSLAGLLLWFNANFPVKSPWEIWLHFIFIFGPIRKVWIITEI